MWYIIIMYVLEHDKTLWWYECNDKKSVHMHNVQIYISRIRGQIMYKSIVFEKIMKLNCKKKWEFFFCNWLFIDLLHDHFRPQFFWYNCLVHDLALGLFLLNMFWAQKKTYLFIYYSTIPQPLNLIIWMEERVNTYKRGSVLI